MLPNVISQNINGLKSGFRFAIAGLLSFIFYHLFDLQFGFWAAVTVSGVMQPNIDMTVEKCLLRLLGTFIGVAISYFSILILNLFPSLLYLVFFIAMFITGLLIFKNRNYSYLGVICGITIIIVLTTYNQTPAFFYGVIVDRTLDIIMGVLIAWGCSTFIFPLKHMNAPPSKPAPAQRPFHIRYALAMAIATTVSLIPWFSIHYRGGFWAPIACLVIVEETMDKTQKKSLDRFIAHVIVLFITALLSFSLNSTYGLGCTLFLGMFFFGFWMEKPLFGFSASMANTMAIAFCIVLLYSPGETNTLHVAIARFINTIAGIAVGMVIVGFINREPRKLTNAH